jgi:hypothetical protein
VRLTRRRPLWQGIAALLCSMASAHAADSELDALALESAPETPAATSGTKVSLEAAVGRARLRGAAGGERETLSRLSADLVLSRRIDKNWRFVLSDRLDHVDPDSGADTINSLRELYAGWQDDAGTWAVEAGRINLRQGPALGFNPTDFFRDQTLRVSTTVNPMLVRDYRLGSVMVRMQRLWADGSLALALSPKLADAPSSRGFSADLGSTNHRDRALLSLGTRWSARSSTLLHVLADSSSRWQLGASGSSLLGDAVVAYGEATTGREPRLLDRAIGRTENVSGTRAVGGLTYTTPFKLSISAELGYNSLALSRSQWDAIATSQPALLGAYLYTADRLQDQAARRSVLVYAKQTDAFTRGLDLTALTRVNTADRSRMVWLEARYRFPQVDVALQWLRYSGKARSEFATTPYKDSVQALATVYF